MTGGHYDVLIVGTGHAGAHAAIELRQQGFSGTIGLVGREVDLPYERPALSKEYLAQEKSFERILLRPEGFWTSRDIDLRPGVEVVAVHAEQRIALLADGRGIRYGTLIWAAGGSARRLTCSGHDLVGVHSIRSRRDVDRLLTELPAVRRAVVIGGGYIGLEAAAVLSKLGKSVIVLEANDRVLARVTGQLISRFFEAEHRARGVDVRTGVTVTCIEGDFGTVRGVRLSDGSLVECDMVIVGIGIIPTIEPLVAAGAEGSNGVAVDRYCRTSLDHVYAIGDCAAHPSEFAPARRVRLESVQNARGQAVTAAKAILGQVEPYAEVPWFWSQQYDVKLQTVGLSTGHDLAVLRGSVQERRFSIAYFLAGQIVSLDCINSARDFVHGKMLVARKARPKPEQVADTTIQLGDLAQVPESIVQASER